MRIGVDFGTTNSSAGYLDGASVQLIPLEGTATVMPSMLYITRDGGHVLGNEAIHTYLAHDTGRPAVYKPFDIGALTEVYASSGGGMTVSIRRVYSLVDVSAPGRLFQSIKTALRDPDFPGTRVFGRFYSLEELIAIVLRHIRERAQVHLGREVDSVVLGRPVSYAAEGLSAEAAAAVERTAVSRMARAARLAGFREVEFAFEPVAAAHRHGQEITKPTTAFVFDFGGGTLDLALMRLHPGGHTEIVATRGVLVGGDDIDSRLALELGRHFGAGSTCGGGKLPFPHHLLDNLAHWQTIPILSRHPYIDNIRTMRREGSDPAAIAALECLACRNHGFELFQEVERGKRALSDDLHTTLRLEVEDIHIHELLTRRRFVVLIADLVRQMRQGIRRLLAATGVASGDVDQVVMTGGSSLIPCVADLLAAEFGRDGLQLSSPFTSIVSGLAAMAGRPDLGLTMPAPAEAAPAGEDKEPWRPAVGDRVRFRLGESEISGQVTAISDPTGVEPLLSVEYFDRGMGDMFTVLRRARDLTQDLTGFGKPVRSLS